VSIKRGGAVSVTTPKGFRAGAAAAGLKTSGLDVAVVVNDGPQAAAAGLVTGNRVKAAPVLWTAQVLKGGALRAVVLNSGGANACTGPAGFQDTHATAERVADGLGIGAGEVAVCSTGLIGERLPMDCLLSGVDSAVAALGPEGGADAAAAIMTTDTRAKTTVVQGEGWSVGGMAKGSGMLAPGMATMLCTLTTDAVADAEQLQTALRDAVRVTLDRIDSDGCMSTNDTVLLLASGASGVSPTSTDLTAAVTAACHDLGQQLVADAEGATKEVAIEVTGAASEHDAVTVGRAVARNNLVKTALFGNDPNWGRILAAVGTTDATFEPDALDVAVNGVWVCKQGAAAEDRSRVDLSRRDVTIQIELHAGEASATIWTNDLSHGYVHENSAYST
jgi:glutamate N-acetyltransferase/amino-acid N-acetyltransferase